MGFQVKGGDMDVPRAIRNASGVLFAGVVFAAVDSPLYACAANLSGYAWGADSSECQAAAQAYGDIYCYAACVDQCERLYLEIVWDGCSLAPSPPNLPGSYETYSMSCHCGP